MNLIGRRAEFMQSMQRTVQQLGCLEEAMAAWTADDTLLTQRAGTEQDIALRRAWLAEADVHAAAVLRLAEGVLQFEVSRDGAFWAGGCIVPRSHFAPHHAAFQAALAARQPAHEGAQQRAQETVPPYTTSSKVVTVNTPRGPVPNTHALAAGLEAVSTALQQAEASLPAMYDAMDIITELREVLQGSEVGELRQPLTMVNAALTDTVGLLAAALVGHAGSATDALALQRAMAGRKGRGQRSAWQPLIRSLLAQLRSMVRVDACCYMLLLLHVVAPTYTVYPQYSSM